MSPDPSDASDGDPVNNGILSRESLRKRLGARLETIRACIEQTPEIIQRTGKADALIRLETLARDLQDMPDRLAAHAWKQAQYDLLHAEAVAGLAAAEDRLRTCAHDLSKAESRQTQRPGQLRQRIGRLKNVLKPYLGADTTRLNERKRGELARAREELPTLERELGTLGTQVSDCRDALEEAQAAAEAAATHDAHIAYQREEAREAFEAACHEAAAELDQISEAAEGLLKEIEDAFVEDLLACAPSEHPSAAA